MNDLQKILHFINLHYTSHTVILNGSRAGNEFCSNSDYDLLCIRKQEQRVREVINDELIYIQEDSLLGHYRRHDLLVKLRSLYLSFKGLWDLGDKHSFSQMKIKAFFPPKE